MACLMCAVAWASTGCATSTARTARQLEKGNVVASGGIDYPGVAFIPHVHGQAMYGVGGKGDVSAHVGTNAATINGGIGARAYLGERLTLGVQGDALLGFELFESSFSVFSGTLDLTTAVRKESAPYVGLSLRAHRYNGAFTEAPEVLLQPGLIAGYDVLLWDDFGLLFEGRATPFFYNPGPDSAFGVIDDVEPGYMPAAQVSVSLYKRWERMPDITPSEPAPRDADPWSTQE